MISTCITKIIRLKVLTLIVNILPGETSPASDPSRRRNASQRWRASKSQWEIPQNRDWVKGDPDEAYSGIWTPEHVLWYQLFIVYSEILRKYMHCRRVNLKPWLYCAYLVVRREESTPRAASGWDGAICWSRRDEDTIASQETRTGRDSTWNGSQNRRRRGKCPATTRREEEDVTADAGNVLLVIFFQTCLLLVQKDLTGFYSYTKVLVENMWSWHIRGRGTTVLISRQQYL